MAVAHPEARADLWLAGLARVQLGLSVTRHWGLVLSGDAIVPARTPWFRLEDLGDVYRPSRVGGRIFAGVELRF